MKLVSLIAALVLVGLCNHSHQVYGRTVQDEASQFHSIIRGRVSNLVNDLIAPYKQTNTYKLIRGFWFSDEAKPIREKFDEYKERAFERFANAFGKQYNSTELPKRMQAFLDRFNQIENWHRQYEDGKVSYDMEINQLADLTEDELKNLNRLDIPDEFENMTAIDVDDDTDEYMSNGGNQTMTKLRSVNKGSLGVQASRSWVNYFPAIRDQSSCGACYAFATADTLAATKAITEGKQRPAAYSTQQLIDCSKEDNGCDGGWPSDTLDYIKKAGGIAKETDYRYRQRASTCQVNSYFGRTTSLERLRGPDYRVLRSESAFLQHISDTGPVIAAMHASSRFQFYKQGLFDDSSCGRRMWNHAVVVAGYGTANGKNYWLIRNSYGSSWGESGYMRMVRGSTQCMLGKMGWGITRV